MEAALERLEQQRASEAPKLAQHDLTDLSDASQALVEALRTILLNSQAFQQAEASIKQDIDAEWLLNVCLTVPSELGAENLARSIWEASQLSDQTQQQAALFDALGESGMEAMFQVAEHMQEIKRIPESTLPKASHQPAAVADTSGGVFVDIEEERRQLLLQEAQDAAQVAAIAKAEAELAMNGAGRTGTHTVTRKSDLQLQKAAKKAQKRADAALKAAKDGGAIIDDDAFLTISTDNFGAGGLMGQSQDAVRELQESLLPEGTREYHEETGLPKGTKRIYGEGYEKVIIPAAQRDEAQLASRLVIDEIMDEECAKAFAGTPSLNPMQSTVYETAFTRRDNMLVCAPTGAGKTNVAMLTLVAHFRDVGLIPGHEGGSLLETGKKVVYIAPMKALAQEVVEKFNSKLKASLGLIVRELTGDMQLTRAEAESADVLVTTPEKWDVVTRKSGNDENSLGNQCGLLIIDEVHLLADERGAVIESVIARLHRLVESRQRQVRLVGLSATLPNYQDVATFLQVPERGLFFFGPEHRPVPLQQQFIGVNARTKDRYIIEQKMNEVCYEVVADSLLQGHQVMVFVHSRKGTGETAGALSEKARKEGDLERLFVTQGKEGRSGEAYDRYSDRVRKSRNREVGLHFENGIGIHHAGMLRGDRKLTEQMFTDGAIKVLCCTATLAWGINLPAHSVVIKGTEIFNPEKGGMVDLSILDVQQIFGRAGRPQFDSFGEASLITKHDGLARYLDKLVRAVPIESNFIKQLADHLNAEVVGGTVTNIPEAATWLMYTYLHVRMLRNPLAYGITADQKADDPMLRNRIKELVTDAAAELDANKMVRYNVGTGNLAVTDLGRVAAHFYIQAESVATFNDKLEVQGDSLTDASLCHLICLATEFENVRIRQEELVEVDDLIVKACPLPVKKPIHDSADKCFVLLQAFISRQRINSFTLISDTNYIASNASRVARAMFEMCLKQSKASPAIKLLRIAKSVDKRQWWFQTPLRQFEGELKSNVLAALESRHVGVEAGYSQFEATLSLLDMEPREVGQLCHWQKGGAKIQQLIRALPNIEIKCAVQPVTSSVLRFHVTLKPLFKWQNRWHGGAQSFWMWIEDGDNNRIYHSEHVIFPRRTHPDPVTLDLTLPAFDPLPNQYFVRLVSESFVGVELLLPVSFRDIKMPSQRTPYTDLIDLTPLPTTALQEPKYEQLYSKFETFNPIQTQLFHVLYHTDAPVFLGAPTGSGKTVVAELALLRMKRLHPRGICIYIAPIKSLARERLKEWKARLGSAPLNWKVLELSGDTHHDQKAVSSADVLVCTPEKWDLISRGWRGTNPSIGDSNVTNGKAFVKLVKLLVIDEIHLLGEERGAVLEAIVSRTRFISKYTAVDREGENDGSDCTRIMGLSTALANPDDLADWIGIDTKGHGPSTRRGLYNFRPSVRPVPMEVHMQGFPGRHYCPRMATMNKPCYAAIKDHSPTKPTLIFVASRRQTRLTAMDIISYAAGDENPKAFLGCSEDYIESVAERIEDEALHHIITYGIGIHHAGLSSRDRDTVERLYLGGEIRVLVATATLAWGVNLPAQFVIVKGTEYYDGKVSRYVDYPLTDVLQMIGRAGRVGFDTTGVALVMVEESKKNFYKKFLYSPFPVESCLDERMCENLNAEIAIGTIRSVVDAVGYLTWTFYARRVKLNPSYYGAASDSEDDVQDFLLQVVKETLDKLKEHGCVEFGEEMGEDREVYSTTLGKAASNYYLQYRTPKQMMVGIKEARKLIMASLEDDETSSNAVETSAPSNGTLTAFSRPARVDEISVAWLLYTLASTHEFDELPVRHNEEYLNQDLSEELMWGADTSEVLAGSARHPNQHRASYHNIDIMGDPHTKCFLLLQAYLERAQLPISDYRNDTKTILDQIPRLLAAMHYIASEESTTAGSFELLCQFARVSQIVATRSLVDNDPLEQLNGFSHNVVTRMKQAAKRLSNQKKQVSSSPTLWELRNLPRKESANCLKTLFRGGDRVDLEKLLNSVYSLPLCRLKDVKVAHEIDKTSGKSIGKLRVNLSIDHGGTGRFRGRDNNDFMTLIMILGSSQRRTLLANSSVGISTRRGGGNQQDKQMELEFDWTAANADGGEGGGHMILRLLWEDIRGMDSEVVLSLSS